MKKSVSIIGGGTAGLMVAAFLDAEKYDINIYEKKASIGRKFLVAGDGGFNLTHSESMGPFIKRYEPSPFLMSALTQFTNQDFIQWLKNNDIPTFTGSSKRIFPVKGIKPIDVLKKIKNVLNVNKVTIHCNHAFSGWNSKNQIQFDNGKLIESDLTIYALGGASWKVTGSDGRWISLFSQKGIKTVPFIASNCTFNINWPTLFIKNHHGTPLKNISICINDKKQLGEVVITHFGLEGNAIYALSSEIQEAIARKVDPIIYIDFKPSLSQEIILDKLKHTSQNITQTLKNKLKLPTAIIDLIKSKTSKDEFLQKATLARMIKSFPLKIIKAGPIDKAISTKGGISVNAVDSTFQLKKMKNHYCIGEMIDWNAPTGGYLIQGCVSMGFHLAKNLND